MRQVGNVTVNRIGSRDSVITIALRSPEAAKALNSGANSTYRVIVFVICVVLATLAFNGVFGATVHGYIRMTIVAAVLHWIVHLIYRIWSDHHRTVSDRAIVRIAARGLSINAPGRDVITVHGRDEIRFSSRPHWLGREEEREERRVNHPVGYEFRDAWEVWCEAGLDVILVASVSNEDDARAIVRHLTDEYLFVTRGASDDIYQPHRAEPV